LRSAGDAVREADFDLTQQAPEGLYLRYYPFGASKARGNMPYKIENEFLHFRGADFVPTKIGPVGLYLSYCPFGPSKAVQKMPYKIKN